MRLPLPMITPAAKSPMAVSPRILRDIEAEPPSAPQHNTCRLDAMDHTRALSTRSGGDEEPDREREHDDGDKTNNERLLCLRATADDALHGAVQTGDAADVALLLQHGRHANEKDAAGQTVLSLAVQLGASGVAEELIRHDAELETKDSNGRTVLWCAAAERQFQVLQLLIRNGADVEAKDSDGRTALWYAAERNRMDMVQELLTFSADIDAQDNYGRTALAYAAKRGHADLLRQLMTLGASIDATDINGRTPLWLATKHGSLRIVNFLIKKGASVREEMKECGSDKVLDTLLTVAGRAGHRKIFQALVEAGAPVNIRSGGDGETPLISAARWEDFADVHLLLIHGGCLRYDDVSEDACPLIPATLATLKTLCAATFEYESLSSHVLERLQAICLQLQQRAANKDDDESTLLSFTSILFRFSCLVLQVKKRPSPLMRFVACHAISSRLQDFHDELDHFVGVLSLGEEDYSWRTDWSELQALTRRRFDELLASDDNLVAGCDREYRKFDAVVLLRHELKNCDGADGASTRESIQRVLERFLSLREVHAPFAPDWFISRDDVEFHSWNIAKSKGGVDYYTGKWRKTNVMVESIPRIKQGVAKAIGDWLQLSHPNVVKLFGACHIRTPKFFVYELVPDGKRLYNFFRDDVNHAAKWKCLYDAALGLQYLHSRDFVHGYLRSKNIFVGSDMVTKLSVVYEAADRAPAAEYDELCCLSEKLSEFISSESFASDIFAFGLIVWEAVTCVYPWGRGILSKGKFRQRPPNVSDAQWTLIEKMCVVDPSERVDIAYVVNQLKRIMLNSEQPGGSDQQGPTEQNATENSHERLDEHLFDELDGNTIPNTLQVLQLKAEKLSDAQWMLDKVYPALAFIFALLKERKLTPADDEVVNFCNTLSRFQRYVRTAVSEKSVYQMARSRQVAEAHYVIYSELDRLLAMLGVSELDPIRVWRDAGTKAANLGEPGCAEREISTYSLVRENKVSGSVKLVHLSTSTSPHDEWTSAGLATAATPPPSWYRSLRELVFVESGEIGQGSFGTIFKGTWLDTPIVIKFMGYEEDIETIPTDLLLHEVRVWHRINHPHILKFYGACHQDKRYFVCEYASNGELREYLSKPGNEHLVWQKLYEAALGLHYLHGENVVHNDLKSDNIMVGTDGNVKLIDFGLSCLLGEAEIQIDVRKMGAVHWRSPEYLAGGRPSFASDVYSFAMCILEVISGDVPWGKGMLAPVVRYNVKRGKIPSLPVSMNEKQSSLIHMMTKFEPSNRARMAFVVDKLSEIAQDERVSRAG